MRLRTQKSVDRFLKKNSEHTERLKNQIAQTPEGSEKEELVEWLKQKEAFKLILLDNLERINKRNELKNQTSQTK
jgi:hypothetical protein